MKILSRLNKITAAPRKDLSDILDFADLNLQDGLDNMLEEASKRMKENIKNYSDTDLTYMKNFWNQAHMIIENYKKELKDFQKQIDSVLEERQALLQKYSINFDSKLGEVEQEMKKRK